MTLLDPLKKLFHHGSGHDKTKDKNNMAATAAQPPTQPLRDPDAMDVDSEGPTGSQQSVGGSTPTSESVTTPTTPTPEAVTANQSPVSGTPLPDQPIPDGAKAPQWKTDNGPSTDKPPAAAESINIPKPTDAPKAAKDTPKEAPKKTEAPKPTPQPEAPKVDKGPVPELKVSIVRASDICVRAPDANVLPLTSPRTCSTAKSQSAVGWTACPCLFRSCRTCSTRRPP